MASQRWTRHSTATGLWQLALGGDVVGTVSFLPDEAGEFMRRVDVVLAALNQLDNVEAASTVFEGINESYVAAGWPSRAAYQSQIAAIRSEVRHRSDGVVADVRAANERAAFDHPMTPPQMSEWADTVLSILVAHDAQDPPTNPNTSPITEEHQ